MAKAQPQQNKTALPLKPVVAAAAKPAAANPEVPQNRPPSTTWKCEVSPIPGGSDLAALTVGAKFGLKCAGAELADFNAKSFSLELPKVDRFRLRILENHQSTTTGVDLVVTSYVPGDTSLKDVVLTDGQNRIGLEGVNFNIKSVIKEDEKDPKPFPPETPVGLMWPTPVIVSMVLIFIAILGLILAFVQRTRRRTKFKAWLVANRTPLSPFDQLNKDLRRILKERRPAEHVHELEIATQTYLSRLFEAPLMTRAPKTILKVVAAGDKKARARLAPITIRLFGEFERVSESLKTGRLDSSEALNKVLPQVHELIREFAEKIQAEYRKRKGATV